MREITISTKVKGFKGDYIIGLPKMSERYALIKELNFKMGAKGDIEVGGDQMDTIIKIAETVEKHLKKINLVHTASGETIKSFEDLEYIVEGQDIINEVSGYLFSGVSLGKK